MPRQDTVMTLAFRASQHLDLPIADESERLRAYLHEHDRVVKALLDSSQLTALAPGRYRYTCLLYTSPSPRDRTRSRMPSSA